MTRKQTWDENGLVDDNILALDPADLRQDKYDEIRVEMDARLAPLIDDERALRDAFDTGSGSQAAVTALKQSRVDIDERGPIVRAAVDALGNDNAAIHGFDVVEAFNAP